jgi:hypothetical protein
VRKTRTFVAVVAALALGVLAYRIGLRNVAAQLWHLRLTLPIVVAASFLRLLLQTRAWRVALCADGLDVPQSRLIGVRLASQAAGYLVSLGPAISEPAKVLLLGSPTDAAAALPATLVETGAYWFTSAILGLAGAFAGLFVIADTRAVWAAAALFGLALPVLVSRRPMLSLLVRAIGRRAPKWLCSAEKAEAQIRSFRDRRPRAARSVLALDAVAQLLTLAEVAGVMWAAGIRPSFLQVIAIEAAGRVVKILGIWIPGRIGADEGGAAASFALLGFPAAAGLMLAVARRARDLLWCAVGIVWAARSGAEKSDEGVSDARPLCTEEC